MHLLQIAKHKSCISSKNQASPINYILPEWENNVWAKNKRDFYHLAGNIEEKKKQKLAATTTTTTITSTSAQQTHFMSFKHTFNSLYD